jgi:hypothetical protein
VIASKPLQIVLIEQRCVAEDQQRLHPRRGSRVGDFDPGAIWKAAIGDDEGISIGREEFPRSRHHLRDIEDIAGPDEDILEQNSNVRMVLDQRDALHSIMLAIYPQGRRGLGIDSATKCMIALRKRCSLRPNVQVERD